MRRRGGRRWSTAIGSTSGGGDLAPRRPSAPPRVVQAEPRGSSTERQPGFAGLAIGLVLTLVHLVGIPVTNTSVNPARSLGPAVFVGGWALGQLWLFVVAPLAGSALAAVVYGAVRHPPAITAAEAEQALPEQRAGRARNAATIPARA